MEIKIHTLYQEFSHVSVNVNKTIFFIGIYCFHRKLYKIHCNTIYNNLKRIYRTSKFLFSGRYIACNSVSGPAKLSSDGKFLLQTIDRWFAR